MTDNYTLLDKPSRNKRKTLKKPINDRGSDMVKDLHDSALRISKRNQSLGKLAMMLIEDIHNHDVGIRGKFRPLSVGEIQELYALSDRTCYDYHNMLVFIFKFYRFIKARKYQVYKELS